MTKHLRNAGRKRPKGEPLSLDLFSKLRKDILQETFPRGCKLTEQQISAAYGVSRTPVREAFRQLETEGLIEMIPNRGAFAVGFTAQEMLDIFALRKLYEIQAVTWAIERITEEEQNTLSETFAFMEFYTAKGDTEKMQNINAGFHQLIYTASRSKALQNALTAYQFYIRHAKGRPPVAGSDLSAALSEHRVIFEAIQDADAVKGIAATGAHMDNALARFCR